MKTGIKYPIGWQDFATLREDGCVYIDKTDLIYQLVNNNKYVFLSRPRRFGKSLLLSTIRYYFEGRKDLFEGLKIFELEKDWHKYPVLFLELSGINPESAGSLESALEFQFREWEKEYNLYAEGLEYSQRFSNIIKGAYSATGEKVVVLVDEYDNPLINTIHKSEIHESFRNLLKAVYSNLKGMDEFIKFSFLTGVSRFSNTTVFSGLNNLVDISFDSRFTAICGFTKEEIEKYLWQGVTDLSQKEDCSHELTMENLKKEYDGYHFSEKLVDIYNPFSLLNCLASQRIDNYWIQTGTPNFLVKRLEHNRLNYSKIFASEETPLTLSTIDASFRSPVALLYQTGYLTIKSYNREERTFNLGIPNKEVDTGLFHYLLEGYYSDETVETINKLKEISRYIKSGKPEIFLEQLQSLLAGIPYSLNEKMSELDFERTLFVIFHVLGFYVHAEFKTSAGRIDLLIETSDYIYVIELKLDKSPEEAIEQIEEKNYGLQWKSARRKIIKIGVSFSSQTRNISGWLIRYT